MPFANKFILTMQFPKIGDMIGEEIAPGNHIQSVEDIRRIMAETTETVYHPVGT